MSYTPRLTIPEKGNPYYNTKGAGGYSTAILGKPTQAGLNVLSNCVGYAFGRFNEIAGNTKMSYLEPRNAELFLSIAQKQGLKTGTTPKLGAVIVWQKGATLNSGDGAGHVAIVEKIVSNTCIVTSESGYNASKPFWTTTRNKGNDGNWGQSSSYKFIGFIYNPAVDANDKISAPAASTSTTTTTTGSGEAVPTRVLKSGDKGADVLWLQKKLRALGYYKDTDDSNFGLFTLEAVLGFQFKTPGLEVDGACGPATRAKIIELTK